MRRSITIIVGAVIVVVLLGFTLFLVRSPGEGDPAGDPVMVGAGDIADFDSPATKDTAKLLDDIDGTVFTVGDNVQGRGSAEEFADYYDPTWGQHKDRTRPAPGNHEYRTPGAAPYYEYFGDAAGDPDKGYYSYDLGEWHVVVLNSNCEKIGGCSANSPQALWLKEDLAANDDKRCTLAYYHHSAFTSGSKYGSQTKMKPAYEVLYAGGVDLVLSGHEGNYERFAPQDPEGNKDPEGIRQFVVGTGGHFLNGFGEILPNSEVRNSSTHGVIKLALHPDSYDWEFVPVKGGSFSDSGSARCHQ